MFKRLAILLLLDSFHYSIETTIIWIDIECSNFFICCFSWQFFIISLNIQNSCCLIILLKKDRPLANYLVLSSFGVVLVCQNHLVQYGQDQIIILNSLLVHVNTNESQCAFGPCSHYKFDFKSLFLLWLLQACSLSIMSFLPRQSQESQLR